jgi:hypothetical protein
MLNLDEIEKEILALEKKDTSYAVVERLAWLYIVRDHLKGETVEDTKRTGEMSGSEFIETCSEVPMPELMGVLNEHMDAIKVVHPKEYMAVINRIEKLKE